MKNLSNKNKFLRHVISIPFIFAPLLPAIILHIVIEIYHQVAFPLYGLKKFRTSKFISFDRERLTYLKGLQWWYCLYCTYMNGAFAYFVAIAGKTEEYWCNIIHKNTEDFVPQPHQKNFAAYNDEQAFREKVAAREAGSIR